MKSSPEDQTSLERDFKENAGRWFLPFFHNSKASHEHSEKKNDKGYILSNVSKVKNEKEKEEEYSTTFPNSLLGTEQLSSFILPNLKIRKIRIFFTFDIKTIVYNK